MISKTTCDDCGTLLAPGARFCRQCGKLLADPSNSSSVTEATTRVLDPSAAADSTSHTQYVNSGPTGPAYMAPGESSFVQSSATTSLQKRGRTGKFLLIGFALVVLFVSVISSVIIAGLWNRPDFRRRRQSRPVVSAPEVPRRPPSLPDTGSPPLIAPPPGAGAVTSNNELIYPGAETVLNINGGQVLQLRTGDSFEKVFAWYSAKLQPAQIIRPPGNATAIIKTEKVAAVITAVDGQMSIMLKQDAP